MNMISPKEFEIIGGTTTSSDGVICYDEVAERVNNLSFNYLEKIGFLEWGGEVLYRDPDDKRYWELRFLKPQRYGLGAPSLFFITDEIALRKYSQII